MIETRSGEQIPQEGLTEAQERLCSQLFDIGAIKFGNFKLKLHDKTPEAPLSPIYIDLRVLPRIPEAKAAAVDVYQELVSPLKFDLLAGIPVAAVSFVSSLSDRLRIGMVTPRTDAKTHGSGAKVDGLLSSDVGKIVLLIDDLVTRADSKLEAASILREQGVKVQDVVVLIDREQGGRDQLKAKRLSLHSALTMGKMLKFYRRSQRLSSVEYENVESKLEALNNFLNNPQS